MEETPFDSKRRLCPDGACVGVLGADGRCSVCRRTESAAAAAADIESTDEEADPMPASTSALPASTSALPSSLSSVSASSSGPSSGSSSTASGFDAKRRLCDDGSCVGVVGADGVCGTCGRRAD